MISPGTSPHSAHLAKDSLAQASTVVLLVHGVGDHSQPHVLKAAEKALSNIQDTKTWLTTLQLPSSESNKPKSSAGALEIRTKDHTHIVIPVIWSRLRLRVAKEAEASWDDSASTSHKFIKRTLEAFFRLLPTVWNCVKCIGVTNGLMRRVLLCTLTALCFLVVLLSTLGGYWLGMKLINWNAVGIVSGHTKWWYSFALVPLLTLLSWIVKRLLIVEDFIGDIAAYVGQVGHRQRAEALLVKLLIDLAALTPGRLLVVGHSLGSVLVTQMVANKPELKPISQRLHLITLGSPLGLLSWLFPTQIRSPASLCSFLNSNSSIVSWANFWRDHDCIGQRLGFLPSIRFAQSSVGDGPHADYWSDARVWRLSVEYLQAAATSTISELQSRWRQAEFDLTDGEKTEGLKRIKFLRFTRSVTLPMAFFTIAIMLLDSSWFAVASLGIRIVLYVLSAFQTTALTVIFWCSVNAADPSFRSPRQYLAALRLADWLVRQALGFFGIAVFLSASLSFIGSGRG